MTKGNPLQKLREFGQSVWLDDIRRGMIKSGELIRIIEDDGLCGITSNPAIFEKSIAEGHDYDDDIRALSGQGRNPEEMYLELTTRDIREAADLFRPTFDKLHGKDGFVSLEVNPHLAHDFPGTVSEARRLWAALDRPNVFIKVPATLEGLKAIRQLISEGINVNVTLLFGLPRYSQVAEAYVSGLEDRVSRGLPVSEISSVASFFLSRIDVLIDPMLRKMIDQGGSKAELAARAIGRTAIAGAKTAYRIFNEIFSGERWMKLEAGGARPQRVLWASTGTKNPEYSDVKYVEELIGPETVTTLPLETLHAYRDHGEPARRLEEKLPEAAAVLESLARLELDIDRLTQQLEDEGIEKFNKPYDTLLRTLGTKGAKSAREAA